MKYVSIDLETTGLDPHFCQILEFGAVLDDGGPLESLQRFHTYVTRPDNRYMGEAYALSMHSKILKRIANREEGYLYTPHDMLWSVVNNWLKKDCDIEGKAVVAGKNFANFDMRFLRSADLYDRWDDLFHHRILDCGSMMARPTDNTPPGLEECLKRSGVEKSVSHTAIDDALDVIRVVRSNFGNQPQVRGFDHLSKPPYRVQERLQDENLGIVAQFGSEDTAKSWIDERRKMPLGTSSMFIIHTPSGEERVYP